MSTIDSDLTEEQRAALHAAAAAADESSTEEPAKPLPPWSDVKALIDALPAIDIIPRELLAPVIAAIAATEPLVRDQLVALLKHKLRGVKAATIDAAIEDAIAALVPPAKSDEGDGDEGNAEEGDGITPEAIAKMTRRCMMAGRPMVYVEDNEARTVDEAIERLVKRAPKIFVRGGQLVTVRRARVVELSVENVRDELSRVATFVDAMGFKLKIIKVPTYVDAMVRARGMYPGMRELAGVATTPILHADGTIFATPGEYDPVTRQVYVPDPIRAWPAIPEAPPTLAEAQAAANEVLEVFDDFPVREACDRAAILALVLTLVGRNRVDGPCPAFMVLANAPRVGKGKIVETAAAIAHGRTIAVVREQKNDAELAKEINSYLRGGRRHVAFDNLTQFGGPVIDALLTARRWDGRTLGKTEMIDYDLANLVVTATANNARLIGDAVQRVLPIRLHTENPHPELRTGWKHALPEDAIFDHVRLHVAALTVLRYGLTLTGPVAAWGSYEAWCRAIRRTVIAALGIDPCDTRTADAAVDETTQTLVELLTAISGLGAGMEWTASKLLEAARGTRGEKGDWIDPPDEALNEALSTLLGDQRRTPRNVGVALRTHKGRKIEMGGGQLAALNERALHGIVQWSVVVAPPPPPAGDETTEATAEALLADESETLL